jgi:hypothetical protein
MSMTNADKFLVAVQTGLIGSLFVAPKKKAEMMLKAIQLTEIYEDDFRDMGQASLNADVDSFLNYALYGTQYEWITSKIGKL